MIVFFHLNSSGFSATWALYFSVNQTSLTIHHHPTSPTFFFHNDTISDGGETPSFLIIFNDFTSQQSVPTSQDCVVYLDGATHKTFQWLTRNSSDGAPDWLGKQGELENKYEMWTKAKLRSSSSSSAIGWNWKFVFISDRVFVSVTVWW